ncbi:hypothetical protein G5V59_12895 [Nocardioides sp. W3-2-3]|uniref:hypothetical protein n=1 Tax=Nocardioides convexus TaxID=2712224 RepID=UPI002418318B|nr:hypothetical protein [Nocardioides convexus]NHA00611.1 hypothetical protein [Nocardioides convexus]
MLQAAMDGGAIAAEPNGGYQGSRPEVLVDLAQARRGGRSASVHWNIHGAVFFAYAERKKCGQVDLSGWCEEDTATLPKALRNWATNHIEDVIADPISSGIAMACEFTDVALAEPMLDGEQTFVPVVPKPPSVIIDSLESTPLNSRDPGLAAAVDRLADVRQRSVSQWVSLRLLELAEPGQRRPPQRGDHPDR